MKTLKMNPMKCYLLFAMALLFHGAGYAQDSHRQLFQKSEIEPCGLLVTYDFHYVKDTIRRTGYYDRQALEIGKTASRYYSLFGEKIDSLFAYAKEESINPNRWKKGNESELYEDFFLNYPQPGQLLVSTGLAQREYQYVEPIPNMMWKTDFAQTSAISGYTCQRATTSFRGRTYEVWYTTEIPVSLGPWKLNGLPGLILQARTMDGLFSWEMVGIERPTNRMIYFYDKTNTKSTKYPMKFIPLIRKQMRSLQEQRWKDPIGLYAQNGIGNEIWIQNPKTGQITKYDKPGSYQKPYIPTLELE